MMPNHIKDSFFNANMVRDLLFCHIIARALFGDCFVCKPQLHWIYLIPMQKAWQLYPARHDHQIAKLRTVVRVRLHLVIGKITLNMTVTPLDEGLNSLGYHRDPTGTPTLRYYSALNARHGCSWLARVSHPNPHCPIISVNLPGYFEILFADRFRIRVC